VTLRCHFSAPLPGSSTNIGSGSVELIDPGNRTTPSGPAYSFSQTSAPAGACFCHSRFPSATLMAATSTASSRVQARYATSPSV
jgi:hypothetical protein